MSLRAVAQQVSVASRTLWYYEPELCQHLIDRYLASRTQRRDHLRHVLEHAMQEDPPLALARVCQRSQYPLLHGLVSFP